MCFHCRLNDDFTDITTVGKIWWHWWKEWISSEAYDSGWIRQFVAAFQMEPVLDSYPCVYPKYIRLCINPLCLAGDHHSSETRHKSELERPLKSWLFLSWWTCDFVRCCVIFMLCYFHVSVWVTVLRAKCCRKCPDANRPNQTVQSDSHGGVRRHSFVLFTSLSVYPLSKQQANNSLILSFILQSCEPFSPLSASVRHAGKSLNLFFTLDAC